MEPRARRLAGLIGAGLAVVFGPGLVQLAGLEWRQRRLDQQLKDLERKRAELQREEQRLKTDPVYVEGLVRTTFKQAKKNELVIPLEDQRTSP